MTHDPFFHPILGGLFGDHEIGAHLCVDATLRHMLTVEAGYAQALGRAGQVPADITEKATVQIRAYTPDIDDLRRGMAVDGLCVPQLVRQLKSALPEELHVALHLGLTSQDVIDTSLTLSLGPMLEVFDTRLRVLSDALKTLEDRFGSNTLQGRTRMQAALPITVADRVSAWRRPIDQHLLRLDQITPNLRMLQLGGPVGTRDGITGDVAGHLADILGLSDPGSSWHTDRAPLADLAGWLSLVTGSLGKIGTDAALMAQQGIDDITMLGGGSSSAMAHKSNPILAETLVTLARYNATQLPAMHHALVHDLERSGSAWALEWMTLPTMLMTTGSALNSATLMCRQISQFGN